MKRSAQPPRASVSIALGACAVLCAAAVSWRLARPEPLSLPDRVAAAKDLARAGDAASSAGPVTVAVPDRALAATLRVDLFPKAPPPLAESAAPEPPPRLEVELVAILITSGNAEGAGAPLRRAFLYDATTQTYATLGVGDALREGVVVTAIDDQSATFEIARAGAGAGGGAGDGSRTLRMELKP